MLGKVHVLVSALVFCLLTLSSVVLHVPQLVALARSGDPAGLSASALLAGVVNYTAWTAYLWSSHSWVLLVTNVLASLAWYAIAVLALPRLRRTRACLLPVVWLLVVTGVGVADPALLGPLLGVGSLLMFVPQAVAAWTLPSLAGLSATTWALSAAQGVAWFVQSLADALLGGLLFGAVATAGSASVLVALAVRGRPAAVALRPVPDLVPQELTVPDILRAGRAAPGGDLLAS